jgi:ferredoxin
MIEPSESRTWVVVERGRCFGRLVGEDSGRGACALCVDACPEIFAKPLDNRPACVRLGIDPAPHLARIREAIQQCPSGRDQACLRQPTSRGAVMMESIRHLAVRATAEGAMRRRALREGTPWKARRRGPCSVGWRR